MMAVRRVAWLLFASAMVVASACGAKKLPPVAPVAPSVLPQVTVVLLPDDDTGKAGRAIVSNAFGTTELSVARASTSIATGQAPSAAEAMSKQDVRQRFDGVRATLPPAPQHFLIYFHFKSDVPMREGRAAIAKIARAVVERPDPEVVVMGHTDTAGPAGGNVQLGRRRAYAVKTMLIDAAVDPARIEMSSYGETLPQVPTGDDVAEPRNRRVEVIVR